MKLDYYRIINLRQIFYGSSLLVAFLAALAMNIFNEINIIDNNEIRSLLHNKLRT